MFYSLLPNPNLRPNFTERKKKHFHEENLDQSQIFSAFLIAPKDLFISYLLRCSMHDWVSRIKLGWIQPVLSMLFKISFTYAVIEWSNWVRSFKIHFEFKFAQPWLKAFWLVLRVWVDNHNFMLEIFFTGPTSTFHDCKQIKRFLPWIPNFFV